jgi:alkylation response protein AidB-like acyl-CoA dehydrogenase
LILLEALGAGCILVLIVWWTMFSGRGETEAQHQAALDQAASEGNPHASADTQPNHGTDRQA